LIDPHGRTITYLRLSVTDRCNLRCAYCMPLKMRFAPRPELLTLEELDRLAARFVAQGIRKLRLTGGEPLVRTGLMDLVRNLSRHRETGALDELTLTTNGTLLADHAEDLARHGVRRINVSLDTLDPDRFRALTRGGEIAPVLAGIDAALAAGLSVKLNAVALRDTLDEAVDLAAFAHERGTSISFIEVMPMGEVEENRIDQHVPMTEVRARLENAFSLTPTTLRTGGPARYVRTATGGIIGFITPLTANFCESCNRVRVTATGTLHPCLGNAHATDLRTILREGREADLDAAIARAIRAKPKAHDFRIAPGATSGPARHMSVTGG
jgi:cyclic pyranopterin phosphate synthase